MAEIEVRSRRAYFVDVGDGAPLLFLHGSMSTSAAWRGITNALNLKYRAISVDLWGYGKSDDWNENWPVDLSSEVDLIENLASSFDQPVHLVGHSHGGTLALEVAKRGRVDLQSLCLFEATPFNILYTHGDVKVFEELENMFLEYFEAVSKNEPHAVRRVIDYWDGRGAYDAMPENIKSFLNSAVPMNIVNVKAGFASTANQQDFSQISIPTLTVYGEETAASCKAMTLAICEWLPNAEVEAIPQAGHFLISTHAEESAKILDSWIKRIATNRQAKQ